MKKIQKQHWKKLSYFYFDLYESDLDFVFKQEP